MGFVLRACLAVTEKKIEIWAEAEVEEKTGAGELWKEVKLMGGNQQLEKRVDGGSAGAAGRRLRWW